MTSSDLLARLDAEIAGVVDRDVPLARFTTYRLGGPARYYVEPTSVDEVVALGAVMAEDGDVPVLVLGRGSNLVVSDEGWPGVVVRLGGAFSYVEQEGAAGLRAGGGTALPLLANWAARRGLAGLEFAIAIPGSVGGAVRMNAGAHGREVRDCLTRARIFDLGSNTTTEEDPSALELAYRTSRLVDGEVVLDAEFQLVAAAPTEVKGRMESYRRHRAETQPGAVQNAGSVFRNPPGDHAGRLVEASGLKGFRVGGARVSELHANFFIAEQGSTAQDVFDLVGEVRRRVTGAFGVDLVPEIRFVGTFREHAGQVEPR